ncbi:uncharacterized protein LOC130625352 [Hydractinia symbiolongicarpus]|uniref:uncharacterized protein LOC130625352 n=1 Tax=Hydractinia symbiolongicarpus TaxID=13093 RepID=UPI00254ED760|nr:uncharacterized protein LOC130625352 [Hydractinia symbiolongicarpus]XP_057296415.1 uncharacterized protein LOC130625352 [Hydractinia symbiolongicarpus]XP_057296416.1 uncharacterized protein LOC130625352 [Hydractinia symbiolongicarpus]
MKCEVLFVYALINVLLSTNNADLNTEITKACKVRPPLTWRTNNAVTKLDNALEHSIGHELYRAQVIPIETIRLYVCRSYPKTRGLSYKTAVTKWKRKMLKLMDDLHTIDSRWSVYQQLKGSSAFGSYSNANTFNEEKVSASLNDVIRNKGSTDKVVAAKIKILLRYMVNAPANFRPGYHQHITSNKKATIW